MTTPPEEPVDIFDRLDFPEDPEPAPEPAPKAEPTASGTGGPKLRRPWLYALVGVAIGLVISWVVLNQGGTGAQQLPADHPPTDAPATPAPVSAEQMAELKAKVDADPTNKDNRLVYGVALFNEGQFGPAEEQWLEATKLDPADPGPWYNLGFLYLSLDPPAADKAEAAWQKVVELVPGTSMADTASQHLGRLNSTARPEASPTPSATR